MLHPDLDLRLGEKLSGSLGADIAGSAAPVVDRSWLGPIEDCQLSNGRSCRDGTPSLVIAW